METESLSTYENNRDADIMEGNMDSGDFESSVDADMRQDKEEDSKSGDKDITDCDEQTCTTDKELNLETDCKKDFTTYESDVEEEEEEDIPLNINADKSDDDSDGADENLEDSDRDETEDAEKEEIDKGENEDAEKEGIDRDENEDTEKEEIEGAKSEDGVADETEQLQRTSDILDNYMNNDDEKPVSGESNNDLSNELDNVDGNNAASNELEKVSQETVLVSDDETADSEKSKTGTSDTEACGENEQASSNILNNSASSQDTNDNSIPSNESKKVDNETILLSDDDTVEYDQSKIETSGTQDSKPCEESERAADVLDKSESVNSEDNDKAHSVESEKKENDEKSEVLDKSESGSNKDDALSTESEKTAADPTLPIEDKAVNAEKSDEGTNDDSDKDNEPSQKLENETTETTGKSDNLPKENVQSPKDDSKSDDINTSKSELLEDQPVDVAKDSNENCTDKIAENASDEVTVVNKSSDEKGHKSPVNDKKSEVVEIMDLTADDDNKPKETLPVKKKRKRRQFKDQNLPKPKRSATTTVARDPLEINPNEAIPKNLLEDEADIDMDEDFDPSLFCPDINMEIEEAPVITNSDLPPVSADGSKSPALLDPVFSTYVDEVTGAEVEFNLTPEEEALRRATFGEKNPVQFTKVHCTACNMHLGSALDGQGNRFVHPLLKVLICKNCYHFYTSGEFEKDEDGSELYCRWCGQGGQVMCCSNCEMVFCKKCIRINFDRKKMAEIRDSEDWICFRCNPSQLIPQRIHCAEFMEYVRTETMRASTLENSTQFMTTDHTQCCNTLKRKATDALPGEVKKRKRKPKEDPDYDPSADKPTPVPSTSGTALPKLVPIVPKPMDANKNANVVKVASPNAPFKIGSTTFRPQIIGNVRPRGPYMPAIPNQAAGQNGPRQMFKLIPNVGVARAPAPRVGIAAVRQPAPSTSTAPAQTHEWFDKTVVSTARVNSNLSYSMSQLKQSQAKAATVQALAVVHNKLQEILSNSINALIQIRKSLRVEFIAGVCTENPAPEVPPPAVSNYRPNDGPSTSGSGIRNARFAAQGSSNSLSKIPISSKPVAAAAAAPIDDDVILVEPPPNEPGPSSLPKPKKQIPIKLPASVSLFKKTPTKVAPDKETAASSSSGTPFLRVKSLTALQSVPSECITIPDDDVRPPPAKVENKPSVQPVKKNAVNAVIVNGTGTEEKVESVETDTVENNQNEVQEKKVSQIDLKKPLSQEVKQMMEVKVVVPKLKIVEKKIQKELKKAASESKNNVKKN